MAALLHDIGKADPRFQAWLRGRVVLPLEADLAKSGGNGRDWTARDRARREAGYPTSGRHELQSVALLQNAEFDATIDRDLLLHLVGSHHGWCRPFAPVAPDELPVEVRFGEWSASSAHRLEYLASGVAERFWRLTRRYGWWGLAYLETLVRLTDQRVSEREQKEKASHAATSN
jgi:CRISPR-associated endonuclease/helicase Cas3